MVSSAVERYTCKTNLKQNYIAYICLKHMISDFLANSYFFIVDTVARATVLCQYSPMLYN